MKISTSGLSVNKLTALVILLLSFQSGNLIFSQETIDVGKTGWDVKRPVIAAACESGCPWGELGDYARMAMEPYGYSVILCRNCNR
jgi:hypothetical protein